MRKLQETSDETFNREIVQLVECLVWDQVVARSSRVFPTTLINTYYSLVEYTKEILATLIKDCRNVSELCRKLNIEPKGNGYYRVRRLIKEFDLDVKHFSQAPWNKDIRYRTKCNRIRPMEEVLKKGSNIQTNQLKKRLFNNGYKEYKCECCGNTEWLGKPIKLELHHINGVHNDNRLENLQILCPNCHSFTNTFRGKNQTRYLNENNANTCTALTPKEIQERNDLKKTLRRKHKETHKEKRKCKFCGKEYETRINNGQNYCCLECANKALSKKPSKEIIIEDIQNIGYNFTKIAKKYGVTANAVCKWFKNYGLYYKRLNIKATDGS